MPNKISRSYHALRNLGSTKMVLIFIGAGIVLVGLIYHFVHKGASPYHFISVAKGSVTETVSVTGSTTPTQSVSLGFQNSGSVANVYYAVGQHVYAGAVLAVLNASDLSAQLKQAQATVDAQTATLNGLKAGSRPEDIASSQATLDKANQDLANMYASISDASIDSYSKANDAVQIQLGPIFTNAQSSNAQLSFQTTDSQNAAAAAFKRSTINAALAAWQASLGQLGVSPLPNGLTTLLSNNLVTLSSIRDLLGSVSQALNGALPNGATTDATIAAYKASVTVALNEANIATKNLNTISQNIASQKLLVAQSQAGLDLKKAGATSADIAAQEAQVEQAQAAVLSAQAKLGNSEIIAPLSGVITQFDAKIGQTALSGSPLVSIISDGSFEIDAQVPETDIGKIAVGNPVTLTFDAFPGETFTGSVFYIDPAQTINQGVVDYKIKASFAKPDPRMKSGLTANLAIETEHKDGVLTLPQYAILQNDQGTFVETLVGTTVTNVPVTLGIQDETGTVEIQKGVTEGEQVINVGLK